MDLFEYFSKPPYYATSLSNELPHLFKSLFGSYDEEINNSNLDKVIYADESKQIYLFRSQEENYFIMKRSVYKIPKESNPIGPSSNVLKEFINDYFNSQIASLCPFNNFKFESKMINLLNQNRIVIETMINEIGDPVYIKVNTYLWKDIAIKCVKQSVNIMAFLEQYKVDFSCINSDNFVIDKNNDIRFIDCSSHPEDIFTTNKVSTKNSNGFIAPEVIYCYSRKAHFNLWKSKVYSWGILCLLLLRAVPNIEEIISLDKFKSVDQHSNILNLINNIKIADENGFVSKIKIILQCSLSFDCEKRLNFQKIKEIMDNFDLLSEDQVKNEIDSYIKNQPCPRFILEKKIDELNFSLEMSNKNKEEIYLAMREFILDAISNLEGEDEMIHYQDQTFKELFESLIKNILKIKENYFQLKEKISNMPVVKEDNSKYIDVLKNLDKEKYNIIKETNSILFEFGSKYSLSTYSEFPNLLKKFGEELKEEYTRMNNKLKKKNTPKEVKHESYQNIKTFEDIFKNFHVKHELKENLEKHNFELQLTEFCLNENEIRLISELMKIQKSYKSLVITQFDQKEFKVSGYTSILKENLVEILCSGIDFSNDLKEIRIAKGLSNQGITLISDTYLKRSNLEILELGGIDLTDVCCPYLARILESNIGLKILLLFAINMTDKGLTIMASNFKYLKRLEQIGIESQLKYDSIHSIAKNLNESCKIEFLYFKGLFGEESFKEILNIILNQNYIKIICIEGVSISDLNLDSFAKSLSKIKSLSRIRIVGGRITELTKNKCINRIKKNSNIEVNIVSLN